MLLRALVASTVGTTIEWYDFLLYSTAAGLVFGRLFFPETDPSTGLLLAFGTYFVGFIARPIGAAIFGHFGDRIGRKATLIATFILMGLGTFLIGVLPGYATIGIWGGVLLSVLRFVQGVGVGGEWGGSVLLAMEWGGQNRRGFIASWPQYGGPAGLLLANLALLIFSAISGEQGFLEWGWRIPFLFSFVLIFVGLYIRLGIMETPAFRQLVEKRKIERQPVVTVIRRHPKEILLSALVRMAEQAPFYIYTSFIFAYGTTALGMDRNAVLVPVLVAALLSAILIPLSGHLSDRFGRKPVYLIGVVGTGIWGFVYFGMLDTKIGILVFIAIALSLVFHDIQYGPQAAMIAESFPTPIRYSGSSIGYQLASIVAGGPAPLIATALLASYHSSMAVAIYILGCAVVSLISLVLMPERAHQDISLEHEEAMAVSGVTVPARAQPAD
ncbi:MAG: MHS family MFS transporter [Chloroflexi bacterium]|nr:MHS family MFS transporter [Chloroflexota bacterium]MBV9894266.1 MHS family MFS transporter [Chloroflexota bacterium]